MLNGFYLCRLLYWCVVLLRFLNRGLGMEVFWWKMVNKRGWCKCNFGCCIMGGGLFNKWVLCWVEVLKGKISIIVWFLRLCILMDVIFYFVFGSLVRFWGLGFFLFWSDVCMLWGKLIVVCRSIFECVFLYLWVRWFFVCVWGVEFGVLE